ncbi:MAG: sigma-70 family RNA polymerase sigma factor [Archangium sp.]|nr:sigma-70 family RNA polymerase sigma factor [Archangium sp.]MDP3569654.1 sigma-70 family RNA polymerase sigma factor [Archangium sp.]
MRDRDRLYREAIQQLAPALARVAAGYEADREVRRDLLQEMHAALWHSLSLFDGRCALKTWTWRVAHNVGAAHLGKHRTRFVELEELPVEHDLEGNLDRSRALARLTELVHALKAADRQLLLLYLEGLDAVSIAEVTGLSSSNVATRVHRLKAALARRFQEGARHG